LPLYLIGLNDRFLPKKALRKKPYLNLTPRYSHITPDLRYMD